MLKRTMRKMGEVIINGKRRLKLILTQVLCAYTVAPTVIYASDTSYLKPLNVMLTIILSILGVVGAIYLAFGIWNFADAYKSRNQGGERDATQSMAAGGVMIGGAIILGLMTS